MSIDSLIEGVIGREGRYSNHPNDPGGETMWGITRTVARQNGYLGDMRSLPRAEAKEIYWKAYVQKPGFAQIISMAPTVAEELIDTGVNMGTAVAAIMLQKCLNAFNDEGRHYADIAEDGQCGPTTLKALSIYLQKRGAEGTEVLRKALNCLQGERYIAIARTRSASEAFVYGWIKNRT